jgi:hypothetical protein
MTDVTANRSATAPALLQEAPLRELIAAGAVSSITALGVDGGFQVEIRFGSAEQGGAARLASARGSARLFASLSTLAALLARLGYARFEVDATHYQRGRVRAAQPERSAAMKAGRLPVAKTAPARAKKSPKK